MPLTEDQSAEELGPFLEETDVFKATSSTDYVVVRRIKLFRSGFVTYHNIEESDRDYKHWIISSRCELKPRSALDIDKPYERFVRPRGQWAITTLVKPKSIGDKGARVELYMFCLSWPSRWAGKGYTSFTFGFEKAAEARHWHARLQECIRAAADARPSRPGSTPSATPLKANPSARRASQGALSEVGGPPRSSGGSATSSGRMLGGWRTSGGAPISADAAGGAYPGGGGGGGYRPLLKSVSSGNKPQGSPGAERTEDSAQAGADIPTAASVPSQLGHRRSATAMPALVSAMSAMEPARASAPGRAALSDGPVAPLANGAAAAPPPPAPHPASADAASTPTSTPAASLRPSRRPTAELSPPPAPLSLSLPAGPAPSGRALDPPRSPSLCPPGSDSSDDEEGGPGPGAGQRMGPATGLGGGMGGVGGGPLQRQTTLGGRRLGGPGAQSRARALARRDVRQSKQRWLPYKQVNGVAIYHRRQTEGDGDLGGGGEFMVSAVVRGSPRRCLECLTQPGGTTTLLGPATEQELLQRRRAEDDKEIQRLVLQAPGLAGVLLAPRELIVETVLKTDDSGPTLVLMFNSCEPPARFVERRPGQAGPAEGEEEEGEDELRSAAGGGRRSWWRRPVGARVRGGYTLAPLEDRTLEDSAETLVTCIVKVDLGGVCGPRSWLRLASELVGWRDAFVDRMLMAVILLRDEVEQDRFVVQPLAMVATAAGVKERQERQHQHQAPDRDRAGERDAGSVPDLCAVARAVRHTLDGTARGAAAAVAAAGGAAGGVAGAGGLRGCVLAAAASIKCAAGGAAGGGGGLSAGAGSRSASTQLPQLPSGADGAEPLLPPMEPDLGWCSAGEGAVGDLGSPCRSPSPVYESLDQVMERMRRLSLLDPAVWSALHAPGLDAPFKVRGPTYLKDRKKIPAGHTRFRLGSLDVIRQPPGNRVHEHVARFIPAIRDSGAPFSLIIHLVIPGTPLLGIVATFVTDRHPRELGQPPAQPMEDDHDWEPFDFVLHKYLSGSTPVRNHMLKLIPHIADGSWMIKQSVGTTPVILGKQLRTIYYETPQYLEIDIDISANNVASYVTGLVRGATRSLVIDMGFVLEGTTPFELPEALLGTLRLYNLDVRNAHPINVDKEIPLRPPTLAPRPPR